MSGAAAMKVFVALHVLDYGSRHLIHFSNLSARAGQNVSAINKQLKIMGGLAGVMIGGAALHYMNQLAHSSTKAAMGVEQLKLEMKGLGLTAVQISKAVEQVDKLNKKHPAITQTQGLRLFKDTYSVLGNYQEAMHAQPLMSKFMLSMRGVYGHKGDEMGWDAVRASELQMGKNFNLNSMAQYLESYSKIAWASGGKISPAEVHAFMKNSPYARMSQTPEAIYKQAMLMMEMGGGRAGTGFQAIDRFAIGHQAAHGVSKQKMELWASYGLLENVQRDKKGRVSDFTLKNQGAYQKDKVAWFYDTFAPALQQKGIDPYDVKSIPKVAQMFSTQTGAGALISTLLQKERNYKEVAMANAAFGISEGAAAYEKSPMGKFEAYQSSLENLQIALGQSLIPLFTELATALTPIIQGVTQFIKEHPKLTQFLFVFSAIGAAALMVAGAIGVVLALAGSVPGLTLGAAAQITAAVIACIAGIAAIITNGEAIKAAWTSLMGSLALLIPGASGAAPVQVRPRMDQFGSLLAPAHKRSTYTPGFGDSFMPFQQTSQPNMIGKVDINIDGYNKDKNELAVAVKDILSDVVNPKAGFRHTTTPGMMHGYA